jgi:hypothetical protein
MEELNETELKEKLAELRKKILTFEWDKDHNQLNAGMESKFLQTKEEYEKLKKKADSLGIGNVESEPAQAQES